MIQVRQTDDYENWFRKLRDRRAKARILIRIHRLALGNPGDARPVGGGVSELRIDHGPGWRVYFRHVDRATAVLLTGGDKATQRQDIERARYLARACEGRRAMNESTSRTAAARTRPWDAADHLEDLEDVVAYLEAAFEDGDPRIVAAALGDVARSRGMTAVAAKAGLGRESLYKALSGDGNPALATVLAVMNALGLRLHPLAADRGTSVSAGAAGPPPARPCAPPSTAGRRPRTGRGEAMNDVQFLKMVSDTRAFRQASWSIENEIARLRVADGDLSPVGGASGWPSHSVWESLKTASHFNLAVALELRLKCLLHLEGIEPPQGRDGHRLAGLHGLFGARGSATEAGLERLFGQAADAHPFSLVAFLSTDGPAVPDGPDDRELRGLADFLAYMDEDAELWRKRYAWERAAGGQWQHYVDDLSAFFAFLDATEGLAMETARKRGIVR